jgi:outer membrane protein assembly factor BamA
LKLFASILITLLPSIYYAQIQFEVVGLESFKIDVKNEIANPLEAENISKDIIKALIADSYLAATIDSIVSDSLAIFAYITPNQKFKWANLSSGNLEKELVNKIDLSNRLFLNRPFSGKNLNQLFERTILYFENNGYPFISVSLDSIFFENGNEISASLLIKKNKFYKIDSLILNGRSGISNNYISRHLGISEGQTYNQASINEITLRIKEISFIEEIRPHEIQFFDDNIKVQLFTQKKKASRFDGVLGLLSNENTGKVELTGDVDLNLINSFNKGENLSFNWRKLQGNSQDLTLGIIYPYFLNTAVGINFDFKLYKQDTTFIDLTTRVGLNYNLRRAEYIHLFIENKNSSLLSRKSIVSSNNGTIPSLGDIKTNLFGIGYRIERLNYKYNPSKGYSILCDFATGRKRLLKINALEELRPNLYDDVQLKSIQYNGKLKAEKFIKIKNRSSFLIANTTGISYSENLYFNELLRIGGLKILRGFDEESINASSYSIFTFEYRFLLDRNSFFSLFSDGGFYEANYQDKYISDTPFGLGAGISFETNAGIFTINYAIGKQFNNPFELRAAKVHFGFINFF